MLNTGFDVRAKANGPFVYPAGTAMIRAMVIDRFGIRSHVEQTILEVYIARLVSDKPGQWLTQTADCVATRIARQPSPASCELVGCAWE